MSIRGYLDLFLSDSCNFSFLISNSAFEFRISACEHRLKKYSKMSKKVLIMIAEKSETVEIVAPVDTLRRIEGIEVTIASIYGKKPVKTTAGIVITPDVALSEVDKDAYDAILMPGGEGYVNLAKSELVGEILRNQYDKGKLVAGICMSPTVFLANGIGLGNKLTSYPLAKDALKDKYEYLEESVVQDKVK